MNRRTILSTTVTPNDAALLQLLGRPDPDRAGISSFDHASVLFQDELKQDSCGRRHQAHRAPYDSLLHGFLRIMT